MNEKQQEIERWKNPPFLPDMRKQIEKLCKVELDDAFSARLEFGTGGLRAVMGPGPNRMNLYTVAAATTGLLQYLAGSTSPVLVIGYDTRHNSSLFAATAATIAAAKKAKVLMFDQPVPVPLLAFAVRKTGADCGIMITASHNPSQYNGYKVFSNDGCQIVPPDDTRLADIINSTPINPAGLALQQFDQLPDGVEPVNDEVIDAYLQTLDSLLPGYDRAVSNNGGTSSIVYSPLHGTGGIFVKKLMEMNRLSGVIYHSAQMIHDGSFSTVPSPNPEDSAALKPALQLAEETGAAAVLATDPDADRTGVAVRNLNGEMISLNGHQAAAVLAEFQLSTMTDGNLLPDNPLLITTIVTTGILDNIARYYNAACKRTLTGFKYIGELMRRVRKAADSGCRDPFKVVFCCEESCGFLTDDYIRDKDGVAAVLLFTRMINRLRECGETVYSYLLKLYRREGVYFEKTVSLQLDGLDGKQRIKRLMKYFREVDLSVLSGQLLASEPEKNRQRLESAFKYVERQDYINGDKFPPDGEDCQTLVADCLPSSDVIRLTTSDNSTVFIRPSGTEPKLKLYFAAANSDVVSPDMSLEEVEKELSGMEVYLETIIQIWKRWINRYE